MDIKKPKSMKQAAAQRLSGAAGDPKLLVLLHTAVALGAGLLITVLDFILTRSIDTTGGLSGLQLRSVLTTAQSVLQLASGVLLPFWQLGILKAAMAFARQERATAPTLLEGFRRFGPVLRLMLLRGVILFGLTMFCVYAGAAVFMATPLSNTATQILTPLITDSSMLTDPTATLDTATMDALTQAMLPVIPIVFGLLILLAVPILYRLRLADYLVLDGENCGALMALSRSLKKTKGNAFALFRLDLSFWWFYLLQGACLLVGYADMLLPLVGVTLPISADSAFFAFYIVSLFLQLALYWRAGAYVQTTQALAYEVLNTEAPAPEQAAPKQPWNY